MVYRELFRRGGAHQIHSAEELATTFRSLMLESEKLENYAKKCKGRSLKFIWSAS